MSGGLHSLATIIKRLEAATSRLEDLAVSQPSALPKSVDVEDEMAQSHTFRNSAVPPPSVQTSSTIAPVPPAIAVEDPKSVVAFDETLIKDKLESFVELTKSFAGPLVVEQVSYVASAFNCLRKTVLTASACTKPDAKGFAELLGPLGQSVSDIVHVPEANRKERQWFNHLTFISEGAPAFGWVQIEPKPAPYIKSMKEAAEFYGNKIIKEYKEKDKKHVEWVRGYLGLLDQLQKYVLEYHTTGLVWNAKGIPLSSYIATKSNVADSSPAGPPPPPPPPPPAPVATSPPASSAGGAAAVFAELNRGEAVTKGLRKVDKSEMTHKNPALRAGNTVPNTPVASPPKRPTKPTKPPSLMGKKPARFTLEGNKWLIEYQENEPALVVEGGELSQTVNLFGCKNTTVHIKGKINAVTLVNCPKTSILVESVISSISVTNSPSFALQITGSAPTIQLDSTDSGQIYLSKECLGVEITTAKCSSINISLPVEGEEEGVFAEVPVPEMFKTLVKDGKLVTTIVEHSG